MLNDVLMRGMLGQAFANVPEEERSRILSIIKENPELFIGIGKAVEERVKKGEDKIVAVQAVMLESKDELMKVLEETSK